MEKWLSSLFISVYIYNSYMVYHVELLSMYKINGGYNCTNINNVYHPTVLLDCHTLIIFEVNDKSGHKSREPESNR